MVLFSALVPSEVPTLKVLEPRSRRLLWAPAAASSTDHSDSPPALLCFVNNRPITFCDQPCLLFLFSFDLQILINNPLPFPKVPYPLSSGLEFRLVNSLSVQPSALCYAFAMTTPSTEPRAPSQTLQVPGPEFIHPVVDGHPAEHLGGPHETTSQAGSRPASIRPPSAINANTMVRYEDADFRQPPGLNYTLRTRKKSIAIFWTLIVLDCVAMPIALYFGLWYGTNLSPNAGR